MSSNSLSNVHLRLCFLELSRAYIWFTDSSEMNNKCITESSSLIIQTIKKEARTNNNILKQNKKEIQLFFLYLACFYFVYSAD